MAQIVRSGYFPDQLSQMLLIPVSRRRVPTDDQRIETLQHATFGYFERVANPANGLVRDNTRSDSPASIVGSGLAMACYAVAAERGYVTREHAVERVLATLRFFWNAEQSERPEATGYRGFFYHFLNVLTGARNGKCELSTLDSAVVFIGGLVAAAYFDGDGADERELRCLADALYRRADWTWALDAFGAVGHGWRPERGFLPYAYCGYNEALFLYVLALASPTYAIPSSSYTRWLSTYKWKTIYGYEFLYAGPLFTHQLSHVWIDFRGIQDEFMRGKNIDYFENSRRATYVQQEYARRNPRGFDGYDEHSWGITASDGPGPANGKLHGRKQKFYAYCARGIPYGTDDGTLSPWAVATSLPFAPEIVLPTLAHLDATRPEMTGEYGYKCSFNPSFSDPAATSGASRQRGKTGSANRKPPGWLSHGYYAVDQGPVVLMIENYRSELIWRLMRNCPYIVDGLRRAGFQGGWLPSPNATAAL